MARPKFSAGYPREYETILVRVGRDMEVITLPPIPGYKAAGLRTSYQAYLACLRAEAQAAPLDVVKRSLGAWAENCIVRLVEGQVQIANRQNDALSLGLRSALENSGVAPLDPLELTEAALTGQIEAHTWKQFAPVPAPADEGCPKCGGYGCPECEPPTAQPESEASPPNASPEQPTTEQAQTQRVIDLTKRWLDK